jgi:dihydrofolate reductase
MSKLRVQCFTISLDGYGAGPHQDRDNPLGVGGEELHKWLRPTRTFKSMFGGKHGTTGVDDDFARRGTDNLGAWILGRNMFSPIRGAWPDDAWRGWWGDNPPYHVPVFVLTHHRRESIASQAAMHVVLEKQSKPTRQSERSKTHLPVRSNWVSG